MALTEWLHSLARPLVRPEDAWTIWAVIVAGTYVAIRLEQSYRWAARVSGPVLALGIAMALSNLGVMPTGSPTYKVVSDYLVPLAIPLLLLRANVVRIARETGWTFLAFHVSALGTIAGAALAVVLLGAWIPDAAKVAGVMTGSYLGGAVNFFAIKESFHVSEDLANPLLVADNVIMAGMFLVMLFIAQSGFFRRHFPHPHSLQTNDQAAENLAAAHWRRKEISLRDLAAALAVAVAIVAAAGLLARWLGPRLPDSWSSMIRTILVNPFVLITFLSMLVATAFHRQVEAIRGAEEIGGYLLYIFLFTIGLPADFWAVLGNLPLLFVLCLVIAVTNLAVTLGLGKLLRLDLEELLLSVNATLGGPPTAAAMAISKGWSRLVLPGLLVGIWGYVIGTFLGILTGEALSSIAP